MTEKIKSFSWKDVMKYRNELFGIAALWIVLFHIYGAVGGASVFPLNVLFRVIAKGNMGVDIFLFLSAVGLSASAQKNSIKAFYTNRIKRVLIPYLIITTPYFIWYDFVATNNGILGFLGDITTVNFWLTGNHPVWYVAFILVMYAVFPLIHKFDVKTKHISTLVLVIVSVFLEYLLYATQSWLYDNAEKALSRLPCFLIGICLASFILKGVKISWWKVVLACVVGVSLFVLISLRSFDIVFVRYVYGVIAVCIIIVYGFLRAIAPLNHLGKALAWLGAISLEIYIVHVLLVRIVGFYDLWNALPKWSWYLLVTVFAIVVAKGIAAAYGAFLSFQGRLLTKRG